MTSTRTTLGRRAFIGLALAGAAGIGGLGLAGSTGARHDGEHNGATPEASPSASPVAAVPEFTVEMHDLRFEPNALTIPANTSVRIVVVNRGAMPHDLVIPGLGIRSSRLSADGTAELEIDAAPGAYAFHCSVFGHDLAGMRGVLTVE